MHAVDNVLYLHGFNSHPTAHKCTLTRRACEQATPCPEFRAPYLVPDPDRAYATAEAELKALNGRTLIVGSSLGGFLGLYLASRFDVAALALINPAVRPSRLARAWVGTEHENPYTGDICVVTERFEQALAAMELERPAAIERCLTLFGTADETLDYRDAEAFLNGARVLISEGDTHGLDRYAEFLPEVLAHGGLRVSQDAINQCLS
ncbi:YqiA/YcfP family alpha/beta fold hydrolase [Larsenimonas salina]|uniref:YqiA/YcfP family alpha/beta fold hydrolase n=1 Tax=Larsenimonas salina TaxID=1295565 RepID=UPI0020745111|nr:YqiA/YcfP family alpha/beta fold hydrolase [Larsenimonas salina]MCM5704826.1 esterase [Larsenimonas salina]